MKAIVHERYGPPDVLELREVDKPVVGDDEVLVRVHATSVNPVDWHTMTGTPYLVRMMAGLLKPKSEFLGVDFAGTVEAVGRDVRQFQPGDEVFGARDGAFADYVCVREERAVVQKPAGITFEQAAAVAVAAISALQGLRDKGQIQSGQKVLINGASGGVGTFAVQIAKSFGAEVTGVCSTRNVEIARSIGPVVGGLQARPQRKGNPRRSRRSEKRSLDRSSRSGGQTTSQFAGREPPGGGSVSGEDQERRSGRPAKAARGRNSDTGHRQAVLAERGSRGAQVSRRRARPGKGRHRRPRERLKRSFVPKLDREGHITLG